jgi:hypothetical protein
MGLAELYKRFNLLLKTETILTVPETTVYVLQSADVNQVIAVYNQKGEELTSIAVINSRHYDYKQLNYRTFLIPDPKNEYLMFVYKASPVPITDIKEELDIPPDMTGALLDYVAYMGHSTINSDNLNETSMYYQRFEKACALLEHHGYRINLHTACLRIQDKGFV